MKIREELKSKGFTDEDINKFVTDAYNRQKNSAINARKEVLDRLTPPSLEELVERLINRIAWEMSTRKQKPSIPEFTGDKNNPIEVFEYNQKYGIKPNKTIENEDGTYTHIYEDGLTVNVKVNLSGIPIPSLEELRQIKIDERRFLAETLNLDEDVAINMQEKKLNKLVLKKEKRFSEYDRR